MSLSKILIEPVFENSLLIKTVKEFKYHNACHLYAITTIPMIFRLRVEYKGGPRPSFVRITDVRIKDKECLFEQTFSGKEELKIDLCGPTIGDKIYRIVFPSPGLYWLELEVLDVNRQTGIETMQRMLDGKEGRGWSCSVTINGKMPKKYFLRQPIIVLDYSQIEQIRLNKRINKLTIVVIIITIISLILSLFL